MFRHVHYINILLISDCTFLRSWQFVQDNWNFLKMFNKRFCGHTCRPPATSCKTGSAVFRTRWRISPRGCAIRSGKESCEASFEDPDHDPVFLLFPIIFFINSDLDPDLYRHKNLDFLLGLNKIFVFCWINARLEEQVSVIRKSPLCYPEAHSEVRSGSTQFSYLNSIPAPDSLSYRRIVKFIHRCLLVW
jgi:hypothetical protein